jgi:hypothetical protein
LLARSRRAKPGSGLCHLPTAFTADAASVVRDGDVFAFISQADFDAGNWHALAQIYNMTNEHAGQVENLQIVF